MGLYDISFVYSRHVEVVTLFLIIGIIYSVWGKIGDTITIIFAILTVTMVEVYTGYKAKKESQLTGESMGVVKTSESISETCGLNDRTNMVHMDSDYNK